MGIDLDEKMVEWEPDRHLTDLGKKVTDWSKTLPVTGGEQGIPGKRQQSAVCAGFIYKFGDFEIEDFGLTKEDYNHVMASSGPPRYDTITGTYYDYGAYENGHPSGIIICTDPDLLVIKGSKDGVVPEEPPPGFVPGTPGNERPDRPDRDGQAARDERQAGRDAKQDERQAGRDENQAERDARRDERKN